MRKIAFWLSLLLAFSIPCEAAVESPLLGSASRVVGIALAGFWIGTVLITGRFRKPTPFHLVMLVFVCWNALTILWTASPSKTTEHITTWIQLFLMIFILWDLYTTPESIRAALQMFVVGSYLALGSTVINFLSGKTVYYGRYTAAGTSPDDLGAILALGIPVAWYLASSRLNPNSPSILRIINYAYIPAALLGIALSATRLALVAALPGILFCLASLGQVRLATRVSIFLLLIAAAYYLLPLIPQESFQRLGTIGTEISSGNLNGRLDLWSQGLVAFEKHPLIGVGSNMFRSVNNENKVAHNSFISVLVELGLVGFVIFGIALTMVIFQMICQPTWDRRLWIAVLASWAMAASTLTWEHRKPTWLFLGLIVANGALSQRRSESEPATETSPSEPGVEASRYRDMPGLSPGTREKPYHV